MSQFGAFLHRIGRWLGLLAGLALCCACSTAVQVQDSGLARAAESPLNDFNLMQDPIPEVLLLAQAQPYAPPSDLNCRALGSEVHQLDQILGPDLDYLPPIDDDNLWEQGWETSAQLGNNFMLDTTESLVPFRGWIRRLSGAKRYARQLNRAISAGIVRRAYLKGWRYTQGCIPETLLQCPGYLRCACPLQLQPSGTLCPV